MDQPGNITGEKLPGFYVLKTLEKGLVHATGIFL
jgi:hypothetical protein